MSVTKVLAGIGLAVVCATSVGQSYPSKPIRFVVATAAGGASDIVARTVAERMQEGLGQPIVVEAKPGANGNLAAEYVARAAPDGYTMMMGTIGVMAINVSMYRKTPFDPLTDFAAVAPLVSFSNTLVVRNDLPVKNVKELIEYARANPGKSVYRLARVGRLAAHGDGGIRPDEQLGHRPRAVQGRGGGTERSPRRAHRHGLQRSARHDAAGQGRPRPGARGERPAAPRVGAGHPDRGRGRRARLLGRRLARNRGPGRDAARSHRHAQRRGEQGAREPGRAQAADRQRGADHARQPGGLRPARPQRARALEEGGHRVEAGRGHRHGRTDWARRFFVSTSLRAG